MPSFGKRGNARRRARSPLFFLAALVALFFTHNSARAQAGDAHSIRSVFVAPLNGAMSADAVRERLIEHLKKSGVVRVVEQAGSADAILHCNVVIWPTGKVSPNPRSSSIVLTNYQGYLSAELSDASKQTLWSYLVTPGHFRMSNIVDDLSDRLSMKLIGALKTGIAASPVAAAASGSTAVSLRAAGATFPAPLYQRWFQSFAEDAGGFPISYDAVGSVAGLTQLSAGKIDMAASDIPAAGDSVSAQGGVLHFPTIVGGVVPIYNLPNAGRTLNMTPQILADIYAGKIHKWDDPRIRQTNGRVSDAEIQVVHRSDGSGTTYAWTSFLDKAGGEWGAGAGASIDWPIGVGAAGNEGVAEEVAKTPNSIGYVELIYAIQHRLSYAAVENPAGRFIKADLDSITAAAADAHTLDGSILNGAARNAYPITTLTWLIVPEAGSNASQRAAMGRFLRWMLTSGQKECSSLGYAPLPHEIVAQELKTVDGLK